MTPDFKEQRMQIPAKGNKQQTNAQKPSFRNEIRDNLEESSNPYYADWAAAFLSEPEIAHDELLDARINMTENNSIEALIEMDPWTQEWERLAEKEERSEKDT